MTLGMQSEIAPTNGKGQEPIWLASYPAGVPATIDADAYPSLAAMLIEACRQHAERPAFECLSAQMTYARVGSRQPRFCGLPGRGGELPSRRPRRHHAAEHAGLPGGLSRRVARRHDGGQRQSALYAARIAGAACRFRRRRHRDHGELRPQAGGSPRVHQNPPRGGGAARRFRADAQALGVQFRQLLYRARGAGVALRKIHDAAGRLRSAAE